MTTNRKVRPLTGYWSQRMGMSKRSNDCSLKALFKCQLLLKATVEQNDNSNVFPQDLRNQSVQL